MYKKVVKENMLDEYWYSSNTGIDRYYTPYVEDKQEELNDVKDLVPPPTEKLNDRQLGDYIDGLITEILPKSPETAIIIFKELLKLHPYLRKREIGFKGQNPYEPHLRKFSQAVDDIIKTK